MSIDTNYFQRCIQTLEAALKYPDQNDLDDITYDIYRAACIKEFEIILEQSGKLLKKRLRAWFATNREADRLTFRDIFRHAAKHDLIDVQACERWLQYRDNRNNTAHNYGEGFTGSTLKLLPGFLADAKALADVIEEAKDD